MPDVRKGDDICHKVLQIYVPCVRFCIGCDKILWRYSAREKRNRYVTVENNEQEKR